MKNRAAAIIIRDHQILLIHRLKPGRDYYVIPGGRIESDETPEKACLREIKEETNLTITLKEKICTIYYHGRLEHYFLAGDQQGEVELGGPEFERYSPDDRYDLEWVGLEKLKYINLKPAHIRQICIDGLIRY